LLGREWGPGAQERLAGAAAAQLVPRKFFTDLPRERRRELLKIVRDNMKDMRGLRDGSAQSVLRLANALEKEPYDPDGIRLAVESYSTGAESLAARSSVIVRDVIARLTPEERKSLAAAIRERGERRKQRK
jgi:Heavy-metal resistance